MTDTRPPNCKHLDNRLYIPCKWFHNTGYDCSFDVLIWFQVFLVLPNGQMILTDLTDEQCSELRIPANHSNNLTRRPDPSSVRVVNDNARFTDETKVSSGSIEDQIIVLEPGTIWDFVVALPPSVKYRVPVVYLWFQISWFGAACLRWRKPSFRGEGYKIFTL